MVHTDLIVADPSDAKLFGDSENDSKFKCRETSKLSLGHFVALQCALSKQKFTDELHKDYPLLFEASEEGPWVGKVSDELVQLVSEIKDKDIPNVVKLWKQVKSAHMGFVNDYPSDVLKAGLKDIREFSLDAIRSKNSVLIRFWL